MKKRKCLIILLTAAMLATTGCGTPMYEITDEEESLLVESAAYLVGKHNIYKKDGLNGALPGEEPAVSQTEETVGQEQEETQAEDTQSAGENQSAAASEAAAAESMDLAKAFSDQASLRVSYKGSKLMDVYREGTYFSLSADPGNTFVVLSFEIKNEGEQTVTIDNSENGKEYYMYGGSVSHVPEKPSFIADSFASFEGKIESGATSKAVLIFQVTKEQAEDLTDVTLTMEKDHTAYAVRLSAE